MSRPPPMVFVVVASHRPVFLRDLLRALRNQTMDPALYETVAVCDYAPGPLGEEFPEVTFHRIDDRSISRKRNAGVSLATGAVVAFTDDDCLPAPDWLECGYRYLSDHPAAAAVEGLTVVEADAPLRDYRRLERFGYRTNNLFCRKEAFEQVNGFDERFTVQREDLDFCFTLLAAGRAIHHCAECAVTHRARPNEPWDLLKNCINRRFDPLLLKKHPHRYRKQVGSPFPPSLLALLFVHLLVALSPLFDLRAFIACCVLDSAAVSALACRRCTGRMPAAQFMSEWVSVLAAPFVLAVALVYGSVRFRRFLFL